MKGAFCAYSIMRPMTYHKEKHRSEKLFDGNDMIFLNATGKLITWLARRGFDCYRKILESKYLVFKLLEN